MHLIKTKFKDPPFNLSPPRGGIHNERSLNQFYLVSASQIMVTSELNYTIPLLQHSGVQARRMLLVVP